MFLQLRRCEACGLHFRYPKDDQSENKKYYQHRYIKAANLPPAEDIENQIKNGFSGFAGEELAEHLATISGFLPQGSRILDYGSSWGYCVYQMIQLGYDAVGFEISQPRVDYGREVLKVHLTSDLSSYSDGSFDGIYFSHVLEHVPNPSAAFGQLSRLLRAGGYLFIFAPNCAGKSAKQLGLKWKPTINEHHVLALTPEFFQRNLPHYGFSLTFTSSPYSQPARSYDQGPFEGDELLVVAQKVN